VTEPLGAAANASASRWRIEADWPPEFGIPKLRRVAGAVWGADLPNFTGHPQFTIQRYPTNRSIYCSRGQVVRRNGCSEISVHLQNRLISIFRLSIPTIYYLYLARARQPSYETTILVRDCCLCLHVQRAARALARRFDEALRPLRLTNGQFSLMMSLNRPEPPTMGAVASLLAMDRTTLTAALKPLERRGLLRTTTDPIDRRARRMELTPRGRKLLARAIPVWKSTHAAIESVLSDEDPDRLRKNLKALSQI
jgi:DNA-binding MarR family transcriptional regulator